MLPFKSKLLKIYKRIRKIHKRQNKFMSLNPTLSPSSNARTNQLSNHASVRSAILAYQALHKKFTANIELLGSLYQFLTSTHLKASTFKDIYVAFKSTYPCNASFSKVKQLCDLFGLKYIKKRQLFDNSPDTRSQRKNFVCHLFRFWSFNDVEVVFFDITSISDHSFKKRFWSTPLNPNYYEPKFTYNMTHLLFAVNSEGKFACRFSKGNLCSEYVLEFFKEVFNIYRGLNRHKRIVFVLDNATMHRTKIVKKFAIDEKCTFLFIAPKNPFLNIAEFYFRFLKSPLRRHHSIQ